MDMLHNGHPIHSSVRTKACTPHTAESIPPPASSWNMLQLFISIEGQPGTTHEQDSRLCWCRAEATPEAMSNDKAPCSLVRRKLREFNKSKGLKYSNSYWYLLSNQDPNASSPGKGSAVFAGSLFRVGRVFFADLRLP